MKNKKDRESSLENFQKIDIRVGKILQAELLSGGKYSTHKLVIDFGDIGVKKSCARLVNYTAEELVGKKIIAVVNFPEKQIGKNLSEVLVLGVPDAGGECVLLVPDSDKMKVPVGGSMY